MHRITVTITDDAERKASLLAFIQAESRAAFISRIVEEHFKEIPLQEIKAMLK